MDILLRAAAILVEVLILGSVMHVLLTGARLTIFDLGLGAKYQKIVAMALTLAGGAVLVFFIAHLILFYPEI